ncbi:TadE/TadG family type IV pilus assembly protein [Alkaliphilus sp. B6464]|uniref:TadE/TadG family type IV pilus assembly protein n=1 Tax=Alkaliphilus sp. B6464 TaxID=2731219 RepID=UPI001BA7DB66|nr:TadE/TadG family type IV pilus assembly protein [Alkaliphilus sp. B6464]QUH22020.1 pilus assembly protein [Alkaliphilus sp. B6464]
MRILRTRKGQVMIEFVLILGIYLFLIGFMISGFQIMHNKMVFNISAYEATRTAIALNPANDTYNTSLAIANANNVLKHAIGVEHVSIDKSESGEYFTYTVQGKVKYLFPIINPNGVGSSKDLDISTSFTMRKEKK